MNNNTPEQSCAMDREAAAHHDALLRQVEQVRAENARLRRKLDDATVLASALQARHRRTMELRDRLFRRLVETRRGFDEARAEMRRIAAAVRRHDGDQWHECTSERECMDALRRQAMPRTPDTGSTT